MVNPVWKVRIAGYLMPEGKDLDYFIKFYVEHIEDGIRRYVKYKITLCALAPWGQ